MAAWASLEAGLNATVERISLVRPLGGGLIKAMADLKAANIIDKKSLAEINYLRQIRNEVVHGAGDQRELITREIVGRVKHYADMYNKSEV